MPDYSHLVIKLMQKMRLHIRFCTNFINPPSEFHIILPGVICIHIQESESLID
jgi:hypothetical protein